MIFLEPYAKPLLFLHLVAGFIALAGGIHCLTRLVLLHRIGFPTMGPIRLHARTFVTAYLAAFVSGILIYPTFRIRVRAEWLDSTHPFVVSLFEMKEHLGLLGLPAAGLAWYLARAMEFRKEEDRQHLPAFYAGLIWATSALAYDACSGWYVASLRSL